MKNVLKSMWAYKYRPDTLDTVILPDRLKNTFNRIISEGDLPNLLLVSPNAGVGKTTIAKIIINNMNVEEFYLNGSLKRGIGNIRELEEFASNTSFNTTMKVVFIDEADKLTPDAQDSLKGFIEEYAEVCRFIFTANNIYGFSEPILSRFQVIRFDLFESEYKEMINQYTNRALCILKENDIEYSDKIVFQVIKDSFPDLRSALQNLQIIYFATGSVKQNFTVSNSIIKNLIKTINTKNIKNVMDFLSTCQGLDYTIIYSKLSSMVELFDSSFSQTTIYFTLADWQHKSINSPDKVLNFIGCIADIIEGGK